MKETMIYVCISFVTFEHPLYSYIFLHRGRFVYCPFLLVRFTSLRYFFFLREAYRLKGGAAQEFCRAISAAIISYWYRMVFGSVPVANFC